MLSALLTYVFVLAVAALCVSQWACAQPSQYRYNYQMWFWQSLAWLVSRKPIAAWIIRRAQRTPYTHIPGYMNRWWVFNPYQKVDGTEIARIPWLPSIRVHHILRRDNDRHPHDHPWDARTIVLDGWYDECRVKSWYRSFTPAYLRRPAVSRPLPPPTTEAHVRSRGYTGPINHGSYHQITDVSEGGVWTLFFTFGHQGQWGFLVDGEKVPFPEYMKRYPDKPWASDDVSNAVADPEQGRG